MPRGKKLSVNNVIMLFIRYLKANKHTSILSLTVIITLLLGLFIISSPPGLYPDPSSGFHVMRSMQKGGGFNLATGPSQNDISKNTSAFLTWWSPGQYLLPYLFVKLLGVNMGQSAAITILFCYMLGISGFYSVFRKLGFSKNISALSIAFIACQQFYTLPFVFYNGGEILLFAFLGWFLYGCFSFKKVSWKLLVFVLFAGWLGFLCKSAFLWMYASGLCCLWITISLKRNSWATWIKNGVYIAIPALLSLSAIYKLFLSRGQNPASSSIGLHFSLAAFGFPVASPLLSGFSVDELFHGLIYRTEPPIFSLGIMLFILSALALTSLMLILAILRYVPDTKYRLVLIVFYAISILFFSCLFLKQAEISYESRHFRIVGLLTIPGAIYLFGKLHRSLKIMFILLWIGIGITSIQFLILGCKFNYTISAHGPSGFAQGYIDQPSLNYLLELDKQQKNAIFVFTTPDLGLEIIRNRIITIQAIGTDFNPDDDRYDGHAGPLYILLPATYVVNGKAKLVLQYFPGYHNFNQKMLTSKYVLYSAQ